MEDIEHVSIVKFMVASMFTCVMRFIVGQGDRIDDPGHHSDSLSRTACNKDHVRAARATPISRCTLALREISSEVRP